MANEKRLIDAHDVWSDIMMLPHNGDMISSEEVEQAIQDAPTVDAVEVVRCKDCKWLESGKDYEPYCNHWKSGLYAEVKPDDFCSYGERREGE